MYIPIFKFSVSGSEWEITGTQAGKNVLGGKGEALVSMCALGLPVPPGWTITTAGCNAWHALEGGFATKDLAKVQAEFMHPLLEASIDNHIDLIEEFGFAPLMSVRSGAPVSMPGMMDTILNVGLTPGNMLEWKERIGERGALDSYRRLIQMLGSTAFGVPRTQFEEALTASREAAGVKEDSDLSIDQLYFLIQNYLHIFETHTGHSFPDTVVEQLDAAIRAVFNSWSNDRAVHYRKLNDIDDGMGTAVTVQAMVFGNMGETSGSGVLFTRDPSTGAKVAMAEYLFDAQGEDVVAGTRTPLNLNVTEPDDGCPKWVHDLAGICVCLEAEYRDMVDVEFTVQEDKLYILQSRVGLRSARAAIKIAYDFVHDNDLPISEALSRVTAEQYKIARRPGIDPSFDVEPNLTGTPACPGVVTGMPVYSSEDAVNCTEPCILVTSETTPDDIAGMHKAVGILTQTGGVTSHAAVVARAMDTPCIVGCTDFDPQGYLEGFDGTGMTIDGGTGRVWVGVDVPLVDISDSPEMRAFSNWCMELGGYCDVSLMNPDDPDAEALITVSEWWGDINVLGVVLDELAELPSRRKLTLDLRPPIFFVPPSDAELIYAFAPKSDTEDTFLHTVQGLLMDRTDLEGLTVYTEAPTQHFVKSMAKQGYTVLRAPQTIADLMSCDTVCPTPDFIANVIGGDTAWHKLCKAFAAAGFEIKLPKQAVQSDYAVFKQLKKYT